MAQHRPPVFECSNGHSFTGITRCPVTPHGVTCAGTVRQVGGAGAKGAR